LFKFDVVQIFLYEILLVNVYQVLYTIAEPSVLINVGLLVGHMTAEIYCRQMRRKSIELRLSKDEKIIGGTLIQDIRLLRRGLQPI
jgi:hypothetical protein